MKVSRRKFLQIAALGAGYGLMPKKAFNFRLQTGVEGI